MTTRTAIAADPSNYHEGRISGVIRYIVIHDGETPETAGAAEGMGNWFARPNIGGSAHSGTDADSICDYVPEEDTAWGAPFVNADGLHLEQSGRASQSLADWSDVYSQQVIANSAIKVSEWGAKYKIPLRPMTDAQLVARNYAGVITHAQATRAFKVAGGHTDPGLYYPLDSLLAQANALLGIVTPPSHVVLPPVKKPASTKIWLKVDGALGRATRARVQQFLRVGVDGIWGPKTITALQRWAGAHPDGVLGPKTWKAVQTRIGARPDGIPGPLTIRALQSYLNRQP